MDVSTATAAPAWGCGFRQTEDRGYTLGSVSAGRRKPDVAWNLNSAQVYRSSFDYVGAEGISGREESLGWAGIGDNGNLENFGTK